MADTPQTIAVDIGDCEQRLQADLEKLAAAAAEGGTALSLQEATRLYCRRHDVGRAYGDVDGGPLDEERQGGHVGRRVKVGNVELRSPTIAVRILMAEARQWDISNLLYDDCPWDDEEQWWVIWSAYLLAHAYDADALERVSLPNADTNAGIRTFAIQLTCETDDIRRAIETLGGGAYPPVDPGDGDGDEKKKATGTASCWSSLRQAVRRAIGCTKSATPTQPGCTEP